MITTVHQVGPDHTVDLVRKRPRLPSTNGRRIREVFGETATNELAIPKPVDKFNFKMGGIDIADQLRGVCTSQMATRRTWLSIFFWEIDSAVTNSYIILPKLDPKWVNLHHKFAVSLAWDYISPQCQAIPVRVARPADQRDGPGLELNPKTKRAKSGGYVTKNNRSNFRLMVSNEQHIPLRVKNGAPAECFNCRRRAESKAGKQNSSFKCKSWGGNSFVQIRKGTVSRPYKGKYSGQK